MDSKRSRVLRGAAWSSLAFAVLLAVAGCSSVGTSQNPAVTGGGCSATGTWYAHFQWNGRTAGDLSFVVGSDGSVQQPAAPGVTPATGTVSVSGDELTFTLSDGSTWTGAADPGCEAITGGTMKSGSGTAGQFTARKNACDADGTWAVAFQWSGRTPGQLELDVVDTNVQQLAGPGVGAASGTITASGTDLTWKLSDGSTWTGSTDSNCQKVAMGTMTSGSGNTGIFVAQKQ